MESIEAAVKQVVLRAARAVVEAEPVVSQLLRCQLEQLQRVFGERGVALDHHCQGRRKLLLDTATPETQQGVAVVMQSEGGEIA